MQRIRITGRPTYIFNYLFIYDIVVPKFKSQYHLNCQPRAIISLGLVRVYLVVSRAIHVKSIRGGGRPLKLRRHGATRTDVAMGHSNEGAASCRAEEGFVRGRPSRKSPRQNFEIVIAKTCDLMHIYS
jgi:hypothetical protein